METPKIKTIEEALSNIEDIIQNYHGNWPDEDEMGEILGELRKLSTSLHTSLVAAVEGKRKTVYDQIETSEDAREYNKAIDYNEGIDDTLTIINSIFKE